jgi:NAD(P)-dependent dehydrogenase (short-subunit alcohol dehydrogenase family)
MSDKPVAIITNATEYAGPGSVAALLAEGFRLVCHDPKFADPAARDRFGPTADRTVSTAASPENLVAETVERYGRLDAVVSNDIMTALPTSPIDTSDAADYRSAFELLTVAPFRLSAAAARVMKLRGKGQIVLVTSGAALTNPVTASAERIVRTSYVVAREAANALARCMALELAGFGIQVNAVAPYLLYSQTFFPSPLGPDDPKFTAYLESKVPMRRWGRDEEIGALIALLASGRAGFVSGQVIAFSGAGA